MEMSSLLSFLRGQVMSDELNNYHVIDLQNGTALISRKQQLTPSERPLASDEIAVNVLVRLNEQLKQQLEEVFEVINQMISDTPHYDDCNSEDPDDVEGCDCGRETDLKRARQFLAKYRGEK